ncbi:CAP domain-containing protein [Halobacillus salinus]|uniref:CAP domain-containing protein n=1 Tax=Halobacillus salinus TaxID=192814 RepID=UPI0009A6526E|nr:CAP domain-containing protein [Halobacillus salinus]
MKRIISLLMITIVLYFIWTRIEPFPNTEQQVSVGIEPVEEPVEEVFQESTSEPVIEESESPEGVKGISDEKLSSLYGQPVYTAPSEFGYEWWVYDQDPLSFEQFGVKSGEVVTAVISTPDKEVEGVEIGAFYKELAETFNFKKTYALGSEQGFRFELTPEDMKERPLISLNDEWSMQLYFDTFTETLSAVRMVRNDILLLMQPYKVVYRGNLPKPVPLDREGWQVVESGMDKQILGLTNHIRKMHDLGTLNLHTGASSVAFSHSRDMDENNYFSHYSQNGDGLKERLSNIEYRQAGENIAAQYVDATAAVHGWLNSKGHREALLEPSYTHIGIGVHQRYYTQNFLTLAE